MTARSPDARQAESPTPNPQAAAGGERETESDLARLCRERRDSLDAMRKLDEDLQRERAQERFYRILHGYR